MQRYEMQRKSDSFRLPMKNKLCNGSEDIRNSLGLN